MLKAVHAIAFRLEKLPLDLVRGTRKGWQGCLFRRDPPFEAIAAMPGRGLILRVRAAVLLGGRLGAPAARRGGHDTAWKYREFF